MNTATPSTLPIRTQPLLKLVLVCTGRRRQMGSGTNGTILSSRKLHARPRPA